MIDDFDKVTEKVTVKVTVKVTDKKEVLAVMIENPGYATTYC